MLGKGKDESVVFDTSDWKLCNIDIDDNDNDDDGDDDRPHE